MTKAMRLLLSAANEGTGEVSRNSTSTSESAHPRMSPSFISRACKARDRGSTIPAQRKVTIALPSLSSKLETLARAFALNGRRIRRRRRRAEIWGISRKPRKNAPEAENLEDGNEK